MTPIDLDAIQRKVHALDYLRGARPVSNAGATDDGLLHHGLPVWCFTGADMWALTDDEAGSALPDDLGPWAFWKRLTIDPTNPDEAEVLALIREHGFCCFDPLPAETEA